MISVRLGVFLKPVLHDGNHDGGKSNSYPNRAEDDHRCACGGSGGQVVADRAESLNSDIEGGVRAVWAPNECTQGR